MKIDKHISQIIDSALITEKNTLINDRRYLHMHPETGYDTQHTEAFIANRLSSIGIDLPESNIGLIGRIRGQNSNKAIILRADIDALPITEQNDIPYRSTVPGKMHACGHDAHAAMLLTASKILYNNRERLPYDVILFFQPAEEGPDLGGAKYMIEDIIEKGWKDSIIAGFALHVFNDYPTGTVSYKYGSMAASADDFFITIKGKGGHVGETQNCIDAISIGAKIVSSLETYLAKRIDPFDQAVFSIGTFNGGEAINAIAETAELGGTIRCQRNELREEIIQNIEKISYGICKSFGADCDVKIIHGLPVLINDDTVVNYAKNISEETVGRDKTVAAKEPKMVAEDFCYIASFVPSCMLFLGSWKEGLPRINHHPRFNIDEDCMNTGVKLLCNFAFYSDQLEKQI